MLQSKGGVDVIKVVNGFVCTCSCDVALAKKGVDPKNPHNDPVKAEQLKEQKGLASGRKVDDGPPGVQSPIAAGAVAAVSFGGSLAALNARQSADVATTTQLLDLLA